jgi:hypothetical protein
MSQSSLANDVAAASAWSFDWHLTKNPWEGPCTGTKSLRISLGKRMNNNGKMMEKWKNDGNLMEQ